jgi:biopolymer transport protein ExbB
MKMLFVLLFSLSLNAYSEENSVETKPENIISLETLLKNVKENGLASEAAYKKREKAFLDNKNQQKRQLSDAKKELKRVKARTAQLKSDFDSNEEDLTELEDELRKSMGNLGEMFGVVRQVSQDTIAIREASLLAVRIQTDGQVLSKLAESKELPDIKELEQLWFELQAHMTMQGTTSKQETNYIDAAGNKAKSDIVNLGPFVVFNENGFLHFDDQTGLLLELKNQPSGASLIDDYWNDAGVVEMLVDPTRGTLLSLGSESPSVLDRIHQGGFVGYIILFIAVLGLSYAVFLLYQYVQTHQKVIAQLASPEQASSDNPLGRVLNVYESHKAEQDLETLEMQLDEAVLKEMPKLEQGLPLIKLLAAVAPLLGLLGTVTGMIATFQSITLFGTGDPKLMAGGISQALITTVLGLVTAIPLLFMHNILSTRSKSIIQILDQQSAGIVAQQAQKEG